MAWERTLRTLERTDVGRSYQLWTHTPPLYDPAKPYPLVLCLDAPWTFGTATDVVRMMSIVKQITPAVVVGLAHDAEGLEVINERAKDFTISSFQPPQLLGIRAEASELGGAEAFRGWLNEVVLPWLGERFEPAELVLVGHSFSALFGVHVLLSSPSMFDKYLLASPSVWWDDKVAFAREADYAAANEDLAAKVFMSMGEHETDELSFHEEFYEQLRSHNYRGLELAWMRFAGESHFSVIQAAVARGLAFLLSPTAMPTA